MVGKPIKGKSFGGCVRYVVDKKEAEILHASGIRAENAATITRDFNLQRSLNSALGKAVGHTVLSWSVEDNARLNDGVMIEIAEKYMRQMRITDTQYLIVKHTDREHPHVHIIFNRVDNNGKTITDQNDYARNAKVCRELTEAYGLHIASGKERVNRQRLRTGDRQRYEIFDALKATLKHARSWDSWRVALDQKGIRTIFKYKSGTDEVQGVSFEKDGMVFKGSAIDRSMSFAGIEKKLLENGRMREQNKAVKQGDKHQEPLQKKEISAGINTNPLGTAGKIVRILLRDEHVSDSPYWEPPKRKKRRRR